MPAINPINPSGFQFYGVSQQPQQKNTAKEVSSNTPSGSSGGDTLQPSTIKIKQEKKTVQFGSRLSRFTELPIVPAERRNVAVDAFSEQFIGASPFLELRAVKGKTPYYFAHRPDAPEGAVHSLIIIRDDDAKKTPYIVMNMSDSTVFGGQPKLMLLAGILDKKGENFITGAKREVNEEGGLENIKLTPLGKGNKVVTSGGLTDEVKRFFYGVAEGTPNLERIEEGENITGHYLLPLEVFLDDKRFSNWFAWASERGYLIESDILMARALADKEQLRQSFLNPDK
jgi:8-oxo-dGTP pyrophosphatase MutT (NUDIX family)